LETAIWKPDHSSRWETRRRLPVRVMR
jgi:hypothetical protein